MLNNENLCEFTQLLADTVINTPQVVLSSCPAHYGLINIHPGLCDHNIYDIYL